MKCPKCGTQNRPGANFCIECRANLGLSFPQVNKPSLGQMAPLSPYLALEGIEFILVPAGEFMMGSPDADPASTSDEWPQHRVYLDAYYISRYPVTSEQYDAFVRATGHYGPGLAFLAPNSPVTVVSWDDARDFCRWLSRKTGRSVRLPTEAEWEKAAQDIRSVGGGLSDRPDGFGVIWEWCVDWYGDEFYQDSPSRNPTGPDFGELKVTRGGPWNGFRVAGRNPDSPSSRYNQYGFRCVIAVGSS